MVLVDIDLHLDPDNNHTRKSEELINQRELFLQNYPKRDQTEKRL